MIYMFISYVLKSNIRFDFISKIDEREVMQRKNVGFRK